MLVEEDNDKKTIIALREIGDGKILVDDLEKSAITRLRKEPDQEAQQEVAEVEESDDFENLYRGQVSKSGVAILPSKRTRKIPETKISKTTKLEENLQTKETKEEEPLQLEEEALEIKEESKVPEEEK